VPKKTKESPLALSEAEEVAEEDAMDVIEPTSHTDSTPPPPTPPSALKPPYVPTDKAATFMSLHPFPQVLDQLGIVSWVCDALLNEVPFGYVSDIAEVAGHDIRTFMSLFIESTPLIRSTLHNHLPPPS
jgi:hypothetical protein